MAGAPSHRRFTKRLLLVASALVLFGAATGPAAELSNRIVLRVNDRIATLYDYRIQLAQRMRELRAASLSPDEQQRLAVEAPKAVMQEIFSELLILSRGDQLAVVPSELDVDDAMARMKERAGLSSDEEFARAVRESGMTLEDLRDQARKQLMWDEVLGREVVPRLKIKDDEIRAYYEDHPEDFRIPERIRVEEIVVLSDTNPATAAVEALANEIRDRLAAAETFDAITADYGERVSGTIDVGWVSEGDLAPALEEALWPLEAGALSTPIAGRGGLHIARVLEREEASLVPYEEAKPMIQRRERQRRYSDEAQKYLEELAQEAFVVQRVPEEAQGFRSSPTGSALEDRRSFTIREPEPPPAEAGPEAGSDSSPPPGGP